jgi:hypothetical protein
VPERAEVLVWDFNNVIYYEPRTRRSHGVGIRELEQADIGELLIGDRNVYFAGPRRTLKLPLHKIIRVEVEKNSFRADTAGDASEFLETIDQQLEKASSHDRVQITRDGGNQYIFDCDDPEFAVNLILRLTAL